MASDIKSTRNRPCRQIMAVLAGVIFMALFFPAPSSGQDQLSTQDDMIQKARESYNDSRFRSSAELYQSYLNAYPNGVYRDEAGFFHASSYYWLRDLDEADRAFAREERVNLKYSEQILYYRGEIASLQRDYNNALVYYDRLLNEYPGSIMAAKALQSRAELHYKEADKFFSQGAYSLALQHYQQTEGVRPEYQPIVSYKLGLCYYKLGDLDRAAKVWNELVKDDSESRQAAVLALYRLARVMEDKSKYGDAEAAYNKLISMDKDGYVSPLAKEGIARVQANSGNVDKAMAYWKSSGRGRELIELCDGFDSGVDHYLHREYPDAVKEFNVLISKGSDSELTWKSKLWLARSYTAQGVSFQAAEAWKEVISDPVRMNDQARLEYAWAILEADPKKAQAAASVLFESGVGYTAEDAMAITALAGLKQDHNSGLAAARKYLETYPSGRHAGELSLASARILFARGDAGAAEKAFETAVREHPDPEQRVVAALELAELLKLQGRFDSALTVLVDAKQAARTASSLSDKTSRSASEIMYAKGSYEKGIKYFEELCASSSGGLACSPDDKFLLFWGYYRSGKYSEALSALDSLRSGGGDWEYRAGFWRGITLLEKGDAKAAFAAFTSLNPASPLEKGLVAWEIARAQQRGGAYKEAMATLTQLGESKPDMGFYVRGAVLKLALESNDFQAYLAGLPKPEDLDRETISESALIGRMRRMAKSGATPAELETVNGYLAVEAATEQIAEEGTLIVAKAGLDGPGRPEAMAMIDQLLAAHPGGKFASEIRLYRAEENFYRRDYQGALSWIERVMPVDLPDDLVFRLLYVKGQCYKQLRQIESMRPNFLAIVKDHAEEGTSQEWLDVGVGLTLAREFTPALFALNLAKTKSDDPRVHAEATYWTGLVQEGTGDLDGAYDTFMSVQKNFSGQGMWVTTSLYEAAGVLVMKKEYDQALDLYRKVLNMSRGDQATSGKVKAKMEEVKAIQKSQGG